MDAGSHPSPGASSLEADGFLGGTPSPSLAIRRRVTPGEGMCPELRCRGKGRQRLLLGFLKPGRAGGAHSGSGRRGGRRTRRRRTRRKAAATSSASATGRSAGGAARGTGLLRREARVRGCRPPPDARSVGPLSAPGHPRGRESWDQYLSPLGAGHPATLSLLLRTAFPRRLRGD